MRRILPVAALCLSLGLGLCGPLQAQRQQRQRQPSLSRDGRAPARPSLTGESSHLLVSAKRLKSVRKVYIAPIDHRLKHRLEEQLTESGLFQVVEVERKADAVIKGTCFAARRLKKVKAEIYMRDRRSGMPMWQDSLRLSYNPPPVAEVVDEIAILMVKHLRTTLQRSAEK